MFQLEVDAGNAIPNIQDAEKQQRILKQDLGHLEGEKAELVYMRNLLESGLRFVKRFACVAIAAFGFMAMFLGYMSMIQGDPIFVPTTALVLLSIVVCTLLYLFDRRLRFELRLNNKRQQRAVELLNKKNVVYAYYTNFLRYEYGKYKVRNAQALKTTLSDYKTYKQTTARIDALRRIMYETEAELEKLLQAKKIDAGRFTIEHFARTVNVVDKIDYARELTAQKEKYEEGLLKLDEKHSVVWALLVDLQEKHGENNVVEQMIQSYFEEVSNVFLNVNNTPNVKEAKDAGLTEMAV
jgi:hypothetical protein